MSSSIEQGTRPHVEAAGRAPGGALRTRQPVALLIAGEPAEADLYALKLRGDGYRVLAASGLERGLELAGARPPDLVFVCLGSWAVPALVLLVLRSDHATRGVPVVLVAEQSRDELAAEVGGLLPAENVVPRRPGAPRLVSRQPRHGPLARWGAT